MTNAEKFKEIFEVSQVDEGDYFAFVWLNHNATEFSIDWWNAEYKEPKTGNWIRYWDEEARCYVYKCPECGNKQPFDTKCCWECGSRLAESQESENRK